MENWYILNNRQKYLSIKNPDFTSIQKLILANRDIYKNEDLLFFNDFDEKNFYSPFLLKDMDKAVNILFNSLRNNENIRIVGDYDQDGVAATTILYKGLREYNKNITYAIPDRIEDGYGINTSIVDSCLKDNINLIITCDNGISAFEAIDYAKSKGIKVIVTDHHEVVKVENKDFIPNADAVINPHRSDCPYPFNNLCGAVVAYKLILALFEKYGKKIGIDIKTVDNLIQFAALGTVCDMMKIINENRAIVIKGLEIMNKNPNKGLKALLNEMSWQKDVDIYAMGFLIGPAINSSGRIYTANLGVELFIEDDIAIVSEYARTLIELNNERKKMTLNAFEVATNRINDENFEKNDIIVLYENSIHESICGLVAGRIKDRFNRPTLILTDASDEGVIKGSGRSINKYDMYENLSQFRNLFISFGGHKMACGLSLYKDDLEKFSFELNQSSTLTKEDFNKVIDIDAKLNFNQISFNLIEEISELKPFGYGFNEPIFASKDVTINSIRILGKDNNVIKLYLKQGENYLDAISFDVENILEKFNLKFGVKNIEELSNIKNVKIDICYKLNINEYNGKKTIQLNLISVR